MRATIIDQVQRNGFGGSRLVDYFVLRTDADEPRMKQILEPVADFPIECRRIGDQVDLRYVSIGNGYRWMPFRVDRRADEMRAYES